MTSDGTAVRPIDFTVGDVETPAASLTVSGGSSNQTLMADANIVLGGTGANRTVTLTPAAGQAGTAAITVAVRDGQLSTGTGFQLTVTATNSAPTIANVAAQVTNEDTPSSTIGFTVGDAETPAANLTVSGSSSVQTLVANANIVFGGTGANRTVTLTPAAGQTGTATITLTVSDGPLTSSGSFLLTVNSGGATAAIGFVQANASIPQTPQSTVTVNYLGAQSVGNLNVVIVGWNDSTALVTSVTDSKGNAYNLAIGPTVLSGQASQAIYFAPNIASATANSNIVTVRFSAAAVFADVRILEYSGLDPVSPLHAVAASSGSITTSSSGTLNVSLANLLLVAGNIVATTTSGPGASFTNRVITSPNGDIAEDRVAAAAGSYSPTPPPSSPRHLLMHIPAVQAH